MVRVFPWLRAGWVNCKFVGVGLWPLIWKNLEEMVSINMVSVSGLSMGLTIKLGKGELFSCIKSSEKYLSCVSCQIFIIKHDHICSFHLPNYKEIHLAASFLKSPIFAILLATGVDVVLSDVGGCLFNSSYYLLFGTLTAAGFSRHKEGSKIQYRRGIFKSKVRFRNWQETHMNIFGFCAKRMESSHFLYKRACGYFF